MTQPADRTDTGRSAGAGLGVRFFGILVSPRATYERVAADPNWIGILVLSLGCVAATTTVFLSTEVGQRAVLEQQIQGMQNFGMTVTDDVYARLEENAPNAVYFALANLAGGGGGGGGGAIVCVVLSGVLYAALYGFLGARATFTQVFASRTLASCSSSSNALSHH